MVRSEAFLSLFTMESTHSKQWYRLTFTSQQLAIIDIQSATAAEARAIAKTLVIDQWYCPDLDDDWEHESTAAITADDVVFPV